jgi:ABC-2 type transport system permease protein
MRQNFKKYWQVFNIGWQTALEYRLSFFFNMLRTSIIPLFMIFFWLALYKGRDQISGYNFSSMVTYYLGVLLLYSNNSGYATEIMSGHIKQGELTNYLLKPVSYFKTVLFYLLPADLFNLVLRISLCLVIYFFMPFKLVKLEPVNIFIFSIFLVVGYLVNFIVNILISLTAFVMTENFMFRLGFLFLMRFFNGFMIPLAFFPPILQKILNFLPFTYQFYFPITILLGKLSFKEIIKGLIILLIISFGLYYLTTILWRRALKSYEAVGR